MEWSTAHVMSTEDRMRALTNDEYGLAIENAWWDKVMSERPSTGRKEFWEFVLTTADIRRMDDGQMPYDELVSQAIELENEDFGNALRVKRNSFEDDDLGKTAEWAAQMGSAMALAPQVQAIDLIQGGETKKAYDGKPFFATDHPVNPYDPGKGVYSNLMTGVPLADADGNAVVASFAAVKAKMRSYKMANGRNRALRPVALMVPPTLETAGLQITQAKFLAATENVLGRDFVSEINGQSNSGGIELIVVNELEDEPDAYYLIAANGGLGLLPLIYSLRRAFEMNSFTGITQVELARFRELEWQIFGRNTAVYGHPFQMIKGKA